MSRRIGSAFSLALLIIGAMFSSTAYAGAAAAQAAPLPPPPDPGPPVEPIHQDLAVFFPSGSADLDADAERLLGETGAYIVGSGPVRVLITGFADRAGDAAYNDRLSERRARAVADRLIRLGVDPTWISIDWKGEREPVVETEDGRKEALNRRVVVMLRR